MLTLPKTIHIESTDFCQAACPACDRETDVTFDKSIKHHLSMHSIIDTLSIECIKQLDKAFMCGNYGDPAAGKYTLNIYKTLRKFNKDIVLGMNTNGGLRKHNWWVELASVLNQSRDYVVFSIDGLEDTNHVYRKNVNWKMVMSNAKSFIDAGGNAHWDMLVFKHNEHQVDTCEQLARDMGFKWFRAKVSKRSFLGGTDRPVNWIRPLVTSGVIECYALKEQSIYLDATGQAHPCCWLSNPLEDFVDIQANWASNPNPVCKATCTVNQNQSNFTNQWQRNTQF